MFKVLFHRPEGLLVGTFAALIVCGALVLWLPLAHRAEAVGFIDALFTSTSAACVTGLTTVDTATRYTRFGQTAILVLIQLGGLGVMTFGALAAQMLRSRLSFTSQAAWQSTFFEEESRGDLRTALRRILIMTLALETLGALVILAGLWSNAPAVGGVYEAVFLAISAFCNAGFSVYSDNLAGLRGSLLIVWAIMFLIVAGGVGYTVLFEVAERGWRRLRRRRHNPLIASLNTKVVLRMTGVLIVGGAALLFVTGLTPAEVTWGEQALHSLFQAVTARTAGFNTLDIGALPMPSLLILIGLMFIGGSPGSCAGGIKTTTAAVWLAQVFTRLSGHEHLTLLGRRIPPDVIRRAALVLGVAALWNGLGVMILSISEGGRPGVRLEQIVFEQVSAFGTVGLSASFTPSLSAVGKLWIIATMFVGRLGPLTIAFAALARPKAPFEYPHERVMIG